MDLKPLRFLLAGPPIVDPQLWLVPADSPLDVMSTGGGNLSARQAAIRRRHLVCLSCKTADRRFAQHGCLLESGLDPVYVIHHKNLFKRLMSTAEQLTKSVGGGRDFNAEPDKPKQTRATAETSVLPASGFFAYSQNCRHFASSSVKQKFRRRSGYARRSCL